MEGKKEKRVMVEKKEKRWWSWLQGGMEVVSGNVDSDCRGVEDVESNDDGDNDRKKEMKFIRGRN